MTAIELFCWVAQPRSKIVQLKSPRDHNFNPETWMKAVYICLIYPIHIFIVYWLIKRFLEKSKNFIVSIIMIILIVFWLMYPACSLLAKRRVYSASRMRCKQTRHHRANHLRAWKDYLRVDKDYLRLEKTIYGLKKTIYGFDL